MSLLATHLASGTEERMPTESKQSSETLLSGNRRKDELTVSAYQPCYAWFLRVQIPTHFRGPECTANTRLMFIKTNLTLLGAYNLRWCLYPTWFITLITKLKCKHKPAGARKSKFKKGRDIKISPQRSRLNLWEFIYWIEKSGAQWSTKFKSSAFINHAKRTALPFHIK